jgi:Ca2+-binding EF-hand superfamily protein
MGSGLSRPSSSHSHEPKVLTSIDSRIVSTLQELSRKRQEEIALGNTKALNFERIVLKFSIARCAFDTIQDLYDQFANEEKEGLDYEGLQNVLKALGADLQEKDVEEIFYESDVVRDNLLSFYEFVVFLAITYLLGLIKKFEYVHTLKNHAEIDTVPSSVGPRPIAEPVVKPARMEPIVAASIPTEVPHAEPETIQYALELMVMAYLLFDGDGSGTIQISEVREVMQSHGRVSKRRMPRENSGLSTSQIRNERIKEMDLNRDGTITFQEFVLTFQRWIGGHE